MSNGTAQTGANLIVGASKLYRAGAAVASQMQWVALFAGRLLVARVFVLSGLTKWDGFTIRDDTFYLFSNEYFSRYALAPTLTNVFAVASSIGEIVLPVLLVLGLFTRVAALGLLFMTLVIQTFVYPEAWWAVHAWWVGVLFVIIVHGPGAASLDRRMGLD